MTARQRSISSVLLEGVRAIRTRSDTSTRQEFLSALNPLVAIISVDRTRSNDVQFGWPARAVLDRLVQSKRLQTVYVTGEVSTPGGLTA